MEQYLHFAISISSNGMYSVIRISNILYGDNEDDISLKIKIAKSLLMAFNDWIGNIMFVVFRLGKFYNASIIKNRCTFKGLWWNLLIYRISKYPLSFFVIYFIIKIIYTLAPNEAIKKR